MNKYITKTQFEATLEAYPSLKEFASNLMSLQERNLSDSTVDEIEGLYFKNAFVFPGLSCVVPSKLLNNIRLYRVRNNIDYKKEDLSSIKTYSYPPSEYCVVNGRGNLKGKSVFYCGHTYFTALKESKIKCGDIGYLSVWNINANHNCEYGSFLPNRLPDNNPWKSMSPVIDNIKNFNSHHNLSKPDHLEFLYNFIAELFIQENQPYSLTSWLADKMLFGYDFVDFIVYQSFELNSAKCNMAFKPSFVDKYILLEKVYLFRAIEVTSANVAMQIIAVGKPGTVKIEWDYPSEDDEAFLERK